MNEIGNKVPISSVFTCKRCFADVSYKSGNTCNTATRIKLHHQCTDLSVSRKKLMSHSQMHLKMQLKWKVILVIKYFAFSRKIPYIYSETINYLIVGSVEITILISTLDFSLCISCWHSDILTAVKEKYAEINYVTVSWKSKNTKVWVIVYFLSFIAHQEYHDTYHIVLFVLWYILYRESSVSLDP